MNLVHQLYPSSCLQVASIPAVVPASNTEAKCPMVDIRTPLTQKEWNIGPHVSWGSQKSADPVSSIRFRGLDRYWNIRQRRFTRQWSLQRRIQYGSRLDSCGYGAESVSGHDQSNHSLCFPRSNLRDPGWREGTREPGHFREANCPICPPFNLIKYSVGTIDL